MIKTRKHCSPYEMGIRLSLIDYLGLRRDNAKCNLINEEKASEYDNVSDNEFFDCDYELNKSLPIDKKFIVDLELIKGNQKNNHGFLHNQKRKVIGIVRKPTHKLPKITESFQFDSTSEETNVKKKVSIDKISGLTKSSANPC